MPSDPWNATNLRNAPIIFRAGVAQTECDIILDNRTLAGLFQLTAPRAPKFDPSRKLSKKRRIVRRDWQLMKKKPSWPSLPPKLLVAILSLKRSPFE
jgi:hypothetical protein